MEQMQEREILGPKEVAEILDLHEKTVRNLLLKGEIPGKRYGTQWRISRQKLYEQFGIGVPSAV